jgi:hypothetical protein
MNERIRELAEQCHRTFSEHHIDLDRFAELIVRECIDAVSDCSIEYCTRPQIVSEIKQHFGFEQ